MTFDISPFTLAAAGIGDHTVTEINHSITFSWLKKKFFIELGFVDKGREGTFQKK